MALYQDRTPEPHVNNTITLPIVCDAAHTGSIWWWSHLVRQTELVYGSNFDPDFWL